MIRLFNKNETNFDHNETILQPIKCRVKEVANGNFELSYESLQDKNIENGKIISAPTPRGNQLFRIYNTKHKLRKTSAKARAIFYDLNANIIEDSRAVSTSGSGALNTILGGTTFPHKFEGQSTVTNIATSYFVRKNPVQAMLGDGGLIARWGGYLYRDNYTIKHIPYGRDLGYDIRYGKNLKGIDVETDDSEVITRALPTWVVDNVVKMLPEKYIDSPLLDAYPFPLVGELRVNVPENERDPQAFVRKEVEAAFKNGLDKPKVNYQFDFVVLRDLPEYRDFMWVEELDLYDTVTVQVPKMDVMVTAALMSYEYDAIKERFISAEIGDARNSMTKSISNSIAKVEQKIDVKASELLAKQQEATDKLSGVTGGNIVINRTPDGEPYEILVMDTDDVSTARNVVRINQQGIGFSNNGVIGPYGVAITIDGHVVADYIDVGTLAAEIIKSGVFADKTGKFYLNMETGALNIGNKIIYNPATNQFTIDGTLIVNAINGTNLDISGKNIQLDGNTSITGDFQVTGNNIRLTGNTAIDGSFTLNGESIHGIISNTINNTSGKMNSSYRDANIYGSQTGLNGNDKRFHFNYGNNSFDIQGRLDVYTDSVRKHTFELNGLSLNTSAGTAEIKPWTNTVNFHTSKPVDFNRGIQVPSLTLNGKGVSVDSNGFLKV